MHIHRADEGTPWPTASFGSWRLWDASVSWSNLEPKKNQWEFQKLDKYVAISKLTNVEILLTLGLTPRWASSRPDEPSAYGPGLAAEPREMNDWRNYVRTIARRYKGRIRTYEIWNEPNAPAFFSGQKEQLLALQKVAYEELKAVDPANILVGPAATENYRWLDSYLNLGAGQYADVISYHFYNPREEPEKLVERISQVKSIMRKHGIEHKPLWNTETGWRIDNSDGTQETLGVDQRWQRLKPRDAAGVVMRALLLGRAAGLDRFYWYAWDNQNMGLIEPGSKQLKLAGQAYKQAYEWMVGATVQECGLSDPVWICDLRDQGGAQFRVVWVTAGELSWKPPKHWLVTAYETILGERQVLSTSGSIPLTGGMPVRVSGKS